MRFTIPIGLRLQATREGGCRSRRFREPQASVAKKAAKPWTAAPSKDALSLLRRVIEQDTEPDPPRGEPILQQLHTPPPNTDEARRWLESPLVGGGGGGGLSAGGVVGISVPTAPMANSLQGFAPKDHRESAAAASCAYNGGPHFSFAQDSSIFVACEDQSEVDEYWDELVSARSISPEADSLDAHALRTRARFSLTRLCRPMLD